jgi:hypothetical protein
LIVETPLPAAIQSRVDLAVQDLATQLGISPEQISVVTAEAVTWPDAGLGCPPPGMRFPQVPVDGILIRLEVDGVVYEYHGGGTREPFLCQPTPAVKSTSPGLERFITPPPAPDQPHVQP